MTSSPRGARSGRPLERLPSARSGTVTLLSALPGAAVSPGSLPAERLRRPRPVAERRPRHPPGVAGSLARVRTPLAVDPKDLNL